MKHLAALALIVSSCAAVPPSPAPDATPPAYASIPKYERGGPIAPPKAIHRVEPEFPLELIRSVRQGSVTVGLVIGEDGIVRDAWFVSGDPRLAKAAIAALRQWTWQPAALDGRPIAVRTETTVGLNTH